MDANCWNMDHTDIAYRGGHTHEADNHGNVNAHEGCDRCVCGNKYWEMDTCIDCGRSVQRSWLEHYADSARGMVDITVGWAVDRLKVNVGMARVVNRDETVTNARMVPTGNGMCVMVVDNV